MGLDHLMKRKNERGAAVVAPFHLASPLKEREREREGVILVEEEGHIYGQHKLSEGEIKDVKMNS